MQVFVAQPEDFSSWLRLAAEVEPLFGPMVDNPDFHLALGRSIERGTAFCIRIEDGPPGSPLLAGMLFFIKPPIYKIGWLAVAQKCRRCGIGKELVEYAFELVKPPAEVIVTTFGPDNDAGKPARLFYEKMGFHPAELAPEGLEGGSRQIYRRMFNQHLS